MMHSEKKDYAKIYSLDEIARSEIDKIVAVEPLDDGTGIVFTRDDDKVSSQKIGFRPFLLLSAPAFLDNFTGDFAIEKLKGNGVFSFIAKFADSKIYDKAVKYLHQSHGWEIGVGPTVVFVDEGVAKNLSSSTLKGDAYGFIFDQQGLMVSLSIEGTKISRIKKK